MFGLSAILSIAVVVLAVILPGRPATPGHGAAGMDGELDDIVDDAVGDATVAAG